MSDTPPAELMVRTGANGDPAVYRQTGRRLAEALIEVVEEHCQLPGPAVLDWGCGAGRVAIHLAALRPHWRLFGCDPDGEAVAWCNANIAADCYEETSILPPIPCPDAQFDVILACSVMTHLAPEIQQVWLPEIRRILQPGGVFIASVHGQAVAEQVAPGLPHLLSISGGVFSDLEDTSYQGILPDHFYRVVLQSKSYTLEAWGQHLAIVDYREAGLEKHDLVVCRKPAEGESR